MAFCKLIDGAKFTDKRGNLIFFNAFDMGEIVRFYEIAPSVTATIRAWQGHENEKKWFYCSRGSFTINLVTINDFKDPSTEITPKKFVLEAIKPAILEISGGYANGFKANEVGSKLMVFSNFTVAASKADDFRYASDKWHFQS